MLGEPHAYFNIDFNEDKSENYEEKDNQVQFQKELGSQLIGTDNNMLDALDKLGLTTKNMSKEVKTLFEVTDQ